MFPSTNTESWLQFLENSWENIYARSRIPIRHKRGTFLKLQLAYSGKLLSLKNPFCVYGRFLNTTLALEYSMTEKLWGVTMFTCSFYILSIFSILAIIIPRIHKEKASSNKTPALTKRMNMDIQKRFLNWKKIFKK